MRKCQKRPIIRQKRPTNTSIPEVRATVRPLAQDVALHELRHSLDPRGHGEGTGSDVHLYSKLGLLEDCHAALRCIMCVCVCVCVCVCLCVFVCVCVYVCV
jgi:hypothetical protein